jgi:hypothetical protein
MSAQSVLHKLVLHIIRQVDKHTHRMCSSVPFAHSAVICDFCNCHTFVHSPHRAPNRLCVKKSTPATIFVRTHSMFIVCMCCVHRQVDSFDTLLRTHARAHVWLHGGGMCIVVTLCAHFALTTALSDQTVLSPLGQSCGQWGCIYQLTTVCVLLFVYVFWGHRSRPQ